jgi:hypothetical protein
VITSILEAKEEVRLDVFLGFILTAIHCRKLYNYHTMMSVVSALQSAPISLLEDLWKQVPPPVQRKYMRLVSLVDPLYNFRNYRRELKKRIDAKSPMIPYFRKIVVTG